MSRAIRAWRDNDALWSVLPGAWLPSQADTQFRTLRDYLAALRIYYDVDCASPRRTRARRSHVQGDPRAARYRHSVVGNSTVKWLKYSRTTPRFHERSLRLLRCNTPIFQ